MKPNLSQAFIIGFLYGSSYKNDDSVKFWCRSEVFENFVKKTLYDNCIDYTLDQEGIRSLVVVDSIKKMTGFLMVFDLGLKDIVSKKIRPYWLNCNDKEIDWAFLIGMFESAGDLKLKKKGSKVIPDIQIWVDGFSDEFENNISPMIDTELIDKRCIAGVIFTQFVITPMFFRNMILNSKVGKFSKAYEKCK